MGCASGARAPLWYKKPPRTKIILKIPDGALSCMHRCQTWEVAWELFRGSNPYMYLTARCTIGNFKNGIVDLHDLRARPLIFLLKKNATTPRG
jgi:hypothetical protein